MLTDINLSEYDDPRHYDLENVLGAEKTFFLDLVEETGGPVLDIACGSGMLAAEIAELGVPVTGIDLSASMLARARERCKDLPVTLTKADCRQFELDDWFPLAIMTGHAFQNLISVEDVEALLSSVYRHLQPGGLFVFETRNPIVSKLASSCSRTFYRKVEDPEGGAVICSIARHYDAARALLDYKIWRENAETGQERVSGGCLRFPTDEGVREALGRAGFMIQLVYGDWDRRPLSGDSPEMIYLCQKPYGYGC